MCRESITNVPSGRRMVGLVKGARPVRLGGISLYKEQVVLDSLRLSHVGGAGGL